MKVILLEKLPNLGDIGTVVKVKPGYARNFLLPTQKAKIATPENIKEAQDHNADLLKNAQQKLKQAQKLAETLAKTKVSIAAAADDEGHLYGSVGITDIVSFFADTDTPIEKKQIALADGAFKTIGEHQAQLLLHPEVNLMISVLVERSTTT